MAYVDTVDHQARKFGGSATVSIFAVAIAGFFLDVTFLPDTPKLPEREKPLVMFPVAGAKERKSELKTFDLPELVKAQPEPKPQPTPEPKPPAEEQVASKQDEKSEPDAEQAQPDVTPGTSTIWTPPPPKVAQEIAEAKQMKKVELPKLVVKDDAFQQKMDVNRPPRLVQAREQRMDDKEVLAAVRGLQLQVTSAPRPAATSLSPQPALDDQGTQDGTVAMRFQVLADGRISGCSVVVSSGSDVLDRRACDLVATFVYEAGTDEHGEKVEKTMLETVEWLGGDAKRVFGRGASDDAVVPARVTPSATSIYRNATVRR
ncbi:TonB family protein [Sphingomonas sp. 3-13AW]|uniref:TonB family protein n=1 Tax=Sphingomonas sp. 3-13AW TaxID=3050450 RepID=UPI003BB67C9E